MSKKLTIKELKALPVGDWVWLVDKKEKVGVYARKCELVDADRNEKREVFCYIGINEFVFELCDYSTKWIAYKNKEAAEVQDELTELQRETVKGVISFLEGLKVKEDDTHIWREHHNDCIDKCKKKLAEEYRIDKSKNS